MALSWEGLIKGFNRAFPQESPRRKLLSIVSIILLFEGVSVIILFSYEGKAVGVFSIALGIFLLILLFPGSHKAPKPVTEDVQKRSLEDPPGIKLIDAIMKRVRNDYIVMIAGATMIALVLVYNFVFSARPEIGDLDTLTMIFGGMIMVYPLMAKKFKIEAAFSLLFLGLVVLFLVVPQAVTSYRHDAGSSVGNWYVHYMLAAPFSGILNLIGITSSSSGNIVVLQFHDGTRQALGISAYCAGLYSFSIFLAAFFSFVLVFERLPAKILMIVLGVGLLVAYLGNLFRMVVIGIVGYYRGIHALLWAHENVGWIIFLSWSAVFWYLLLGYASKHAVGSTGALEAN
jgi:archaeosortase C (PEF-CTERM variant)